VYQQYWLAKRSEKSFEGHLNFIKAAYCHPKIYKDANKVEHWVQPMLKKYNLDSQIYTLLQVCHDERGYATTLYCHLVQIGVDESIFS